MKAVVDAHDEHCYKRPPSGAITVQDEFRPWSRPSGEVIAPEDLVFVRKEHFGRSEHKILSVDDGPYRVKGVTATTVIVKVKIGDKLERLSQYQVVKVTKPDAHIRGMILKEGLRSEKKRKSGWILR